MAMFTWRAVLQQLDQIYVCILLRAKYSVNTNTETIMFFQFRHVDAYVKFSVCLFVLSQKQIKITHSTSPNGRSDLNNSNKNEFSFSVLFKDFTKR